MFKKGLTPIIIVLIIALLVLGVIGGYWYFKNKSSKLNTVATTTTTEELTTTTTTTTTTTNPKITTTTTKPKTTTTINQQKAKMFKCGDSITFTYKGDLVTYGTVESQGRCWLDRNLGASRVATAHNDSLAYGDLFQWGRLDDGHQDRNSETITTLSSADTPGHSNFIMNQDFPYDWRSPQNNNLWQGVNGINNPCPLGWRIPTTAEWDTERLSWSQQNYIGAFASPLKLTAAGYRFYGNASLGNVGSIGNYWGNTTMGGASAYVLCFYGSNADVYDGARAGGFSVRCLKD